MNNNEKLKKFITDNELSQVATAKLLHISYDGLRNWLKPAYTPCPGWVMPFLDCLKSSKKI